MDLVIALSHAQRRCVMVARRRNRWPMNSWTDVEPLLDSVCDFPRARDQSEITNMTNLRTLASGIALVALVMLQGCYTTPPTPTTVPGRPMSERFEQSWQAARGAASDANVRVTFEDRASGTLRGEQGSSKVSITLVPQPDESIQVGFAVTGGSSSQDANLKEHLTRAYQRRMGR
jgi:hypothetical protein